jgi:hypothetical protein
VTIERRPPSNSFSRKRLEEDELSDARLPGKIGIATDGVIWHRQRRRLTERRDRTRERRSSLNRRRDRTRQRRQRQTN